MNMDMNAAHQARHQFWLSFWRGGADMSAVRAASAALDGCDVCGSEKRTRPLPGFAPFGSVLRLKQEQLCSRSTAPALDVGGPFPGCPLDVNGRKGVPRGQ